MVVRHSPVPPLLFKKQKKQNIYRKVEKLRGIVEAYTSCIYVLPVSYPKSRPPIPAEKASRRTYGFLHEREKHSLKADASTS